MIGIRFYFGYNIEPELRAKLISDAGFKSIITSADKKYNKQNGTIAKQVKLFKKYNLKPSSLHMVYNSCQLPYFWKKGFKGFKLKQNLIRDVKTAHRYGFASVVVHLIGQYSKVGENRLLSVLKLCKKLNVFLAIENINHKQIFLDTLNNINHSHLKVCYDSGHNNIFDKDFDYVSKFADKIVALHLHDNIGLNDDHTLNMFGNTNWEDVAKQLSKLPDINLDYELAMLVKNNINENQCLTKCYKQGVWLQEKINYYRNKNGKNKPN